MWCKCCSINSLCCMTSLVLQRHLPRGDQGCAVSGGSSEDRPCRKGREAGVVRLTSRAQLRTEHVHFTEVRMPSTHALSHAPLKSTPFVTGTAQALTPLSLVLSKADSSTSANHIGITLPSAKRSLKASDSIFVQILFGAHPTEGYLLRRRAGNSGDTINTVRHGCCIAAEALLCAQPSKANAVHMTTHEKS